MKLLLQRHTFKDHYTIGKLYCDGRYFCDTLEDTVREFGKKGEGKIYGETAIPYGNYKVIINFSNRFKCLMPLLVDVPFFEGIRIHSGNIAEHTHGCILVGVNDVTGMIHHSKDTFNELMNRLQRDRENSIEII
jgi:hypothetical protein